METDENPPDQQELAQIDAREQHDHLKPTSMGLSLDQVDPWTEESIAIAADSTETPPDLTPALSAATISPELRDKPLSSDPDAPVAQLEDPNDQKPSKPKKKKKSKKSSSSKLTISLPGVSSAKSTSTSTVNSEQSITKRPDSNVPSRIIFRQNPWDTFVSIKLQDAESIGEFRIPEHEETSKARLWKWTKNLAKSEAEPAEFGPVDYEIMDTQTLDNPESRNQWASWAQHVKPNDTSDNDSNQQQPTSWPEFKPDIDSDLEDLVERSRNLSQCQLQKPEKNRVAKQWDGDIRSLSEFSRDELMQISPADQALEKQRLIDRIQLLSTLLVEHLETRELVIAQNHACKSRITTLLETLAKNNKDTFIKNQRKLAMNSLSIKR